MNQTLTQNQNQKSDKETRLREVSDLASLVTLFPKLVAIYSSISDRWDCDISQDEFKDWLIRHFNNGAWYFADVDESGELIYFAAIQSNSPVEAFFWLFYMNAKHRDKTQRVTSELKSFMRDQGFVVCYLSTTRLTSSYDRWLNKQGAELFSRTYKLPL